MKTVVIIKLFDKILEATSFFVVLLVKILIIFSALIIIFNQDDTWNPGLFGASIFLALIVKWKIRPRPKKLAIKNFMPGKPERDGIRYLRGKRAKEYRRAWDDTNTYLYFGGFRSFFLNIRLYLARLVGLRKNYFYERHLYSPFDRRMLDQFLVGYNIEEVKKDPSSEPNLIYKIRYKYIKFKYRKENKRFVYWVRVTSYEKKWVVYVWHEDFDKYKKLNRKRAKTKKNN